MVVTHGTAVADRADLARGIAIRAGSEVDTDDRTTGKDPSATLVFRVPPPRLAWCSTNWDDDSARNGRAI